MVGVLETVQPADGRAVRRFRVSERREQLSLNVITPFGSNKLVGRIGAKPLVLYRHDHLHYEEPVTQQVAPPLNLLFGRTTSSDSLRECTLLAGSAVRKRIPKSGRR